MNVDDLPSEEMYQPTEHIEPTSSWEAFKAGFVDANSVASQVIYDEEHSVERDAERQEQQDYVDGLYDVDEHTPDRFKEEYNLLYAQTTSKREAANLTRNLDRKMSFYEDMSGHPVASFLGGMIGGVFDPYQLPLVFLMPQGAILTKAARARIGFTGALAHGTKVGMAAGALAEVTNATPGRSAQEQIYSTVASGMFNGVLAGGGHQLGLMNRAIQQADVDMRVIDSHPVLNELGPLPKYDGEVPGHIVETAARKVDEEIEAGNIDINGREEAIDDLVQSAVQTSSELKYPKFYKTAAAMSPGVRLLASPIHEGRALAASLLFSPLQRKSMRVDPPVDVVLRMQTNQFKVRTQLTFTKRFKEYTKATAEGRMQKSEFSTEVSQAIADGGVHENLHVQNAAKDIMKDVDAIQSRLLKQGIYKHGYEGFDKLTVDDLMAVGLNEKQIQQVFRKGKRSDEEYATELADFRSGFKGTNREKAIARLQKKFYPDGEVEGNYGRYAAGLNKMANKIILNTSAKTREFRARVKELEAQFLTGQEAGVMNFEFEVKLQELMNEYKIPGVDKKIADLDKKYFPDPEEQRRAYDQAVEDMHLKADAQEAGAFALKQEELRQPTVEVNTDGVVKLPEDVLAKLHEDGRLDMINAETSGDAGFMFRQWDPRKIKQDPRGFEEHLTALLKEEFERVKGSSDIDARIRESEERISSLKETQKAETAKGKVKREASQEELDIQEELAFAKHNEDADMIAELEAKLEENSAEARQLKEEEATLKRLIKRKEEEWADIEAEVPGQVRDIRNRIMHQTHKQGFKTVSLESLTLGDRTVHLSYDKIKQWLNTDVLESLSRYSERRLPEVIMAERFGGTDGFKKEVQKVMTKYDEAIAAAEGKASTKLMSQKGKFLRDIEAMEETIFRRFGLSENPDGILHKGSQYLRWWNMLTSLGLMAFSAIPDLGSIVARQGANAMQFHKYAWSAEGKAFRAHLDDIGISADIVLSQAHERFTLADSEFGTQSRVDAFARSAVHKFNNLTGMNHWNAHLKRFVASVYGMGMVRDAHKFKAGKLGAKELARYRTSFIDEKHLLQIAEVTRPGEPLDVSTWPEALRDRFSAALFSEADTVIVTPTLGDLPLAASSDLGKIVLQFKSFAIASNHKMMLSTIDDITAQKMIGMMAMVFFGHVSQAAKAAIKGKPLSDDPQQLVKNAVAGSGIGTLGLEINAIIERMTSGQLSAWNAMGLDTGDAITFNQNMSALELAFGPTSGLVNNAKHIATMAASGEIRESDVRAMRRITWLNNHWAAYRGFNKLEELATERWAR